MSYQIYCDNELIFKTGNTALSAVSASCSLQINSAGSISFTIPQDHPKFGTIHKLKSTIQLLRGDEVIFYGRVLNVISNYLNLTTFECEGCLAFLNDTIIRPYDYSTGGISIADYLSDILAQHNANVDASRQLKLGNIGYTDVIYRKQSEYVSAWSEIKEKLIDSVGGYLLPRYEADGIYLDYLPIITRKSDQKITVSTNLVDLTKKIDGAEIITAVVPLGAKQEDGSYLTIEGVNGGKNYIEDATAVATFGRITKAVKWEDVTLTSNLMIKGQQWLNSHSLEKLQLNVSAVDLANVGGSSHFMFASNVDVYSKQHGITTSMLISAMNLDLVNPANDKLSLSSLAKTMSEIITSGNSSVRVQIAETSNEVTKTLRTEIQQTADSITSTVVANYSTKEEVRTVFRVDEDGTAIGRTDMPDYIRVGYDGGNTGVFIKDSATGETYTSMQRKEFQTGEWHMQQTGNLFNIFRKG